MDLIDTHQHLILRGKLGYARHEGSPALREASPKADYAALVRGCGVVGTIFMESGWMTATIRLRLASSPA